MNRTQIANLSLTFIGEDPIQSLEEVGHVSLVIRSVWDLCKGILLRSHTWVHARVIRELAISESRNELNDSHPYMYYLPFDCMRLACVFPKETQYEIRGNIVYSHTKIKHFDYVSSSVSEDMYDVSMCELFSIKLAEMIVVKLTGNLQRREYFLQQFERKLMIARGQDACESNRIRPYESLLESRGH